MVLLNEPNSQIIIRANMARLYIDTDRPAQARRLLDNLLANPALAPDYRAIILGYQAMALNTLARLGGALRTLDEAQALYQQLGYPDAGARLLETRARALQGTGEKQLALQLLTTRGAAEPAARRCRPACWPIRGRYPEAYRALSEYVSDYKQHFNQTLSQHAAAFQAEMDLARSEASNRALQRENESKRQQLLHQQSARYYQLMLVGLLTGALLLLGLTTHRLHRSSRHLYKLATFDQLTGLPNRRALLGGAGAAVAAGSSPDPDHHRHRSFQSRSTTGTVTQAGDQAIRQLARELKSWAPDQHQIGRLGGEEFLVAMEQDGATCWRLAEQLRNRIAYLAAPT